MFSSKPGTPTTSQGFLHLLITPFLFFHVRSHSHKNTSSYLPVGLPPPPLLASFLFLSFPCLPSSRPHTVHLLIQLIYLHSTFLSVRGPFRKIRGPLFRSSYAHQNSSNQLNHGAEIVCLQRDSDKYYPGSWLSCYYYVTYGIYLGFWGTVAVWTGVCVSPRCSGLACLHVQQVGVFSSP